MLIENIDEILDVENDCVDVSVEDENGYIFTVLLATPIYFLDQMTKEKSNFSPPNGLVIIV